MTQDAKTYYIWVGGSCDYGHKERAGGAAVVIEKDGKVSDIQTMKSLYPLLDKEAVRVVSMMPKWNPGMINGQPVRVSNNIRVKFMLK